jgi:ubiquinone/menaquinone biosynthesis C-methylase UbiE
LYGRSAVYYDNIYGFKNYRRESEKLHTFIERRKKAPGNTLLDVACGTGNHLMYLKRWYDVEGLDVNPAMLRQARKKHPGIIFRQGDMCKFHLANRFDVITCLFSAIGHVKTKTRMRQAVGRMARHLKPGGLLVLEPWITPDRWSVGYLSANFVDQPDLKLARLSVSKRRANLSVNDEHHLVASTKGIEYFVERLEMGLFTGDDYQDAFKDAGLGVSYDTEGLIGRGLYFGSKPAE